MRAARSARSGSIPGRPRLCEMRPSTSATCVSASPIDRRSARAKSSAGHIAAGDGHVAGRLPELHEPRAWERRHRLARAAGSRDRQHEIEKRRVGFRGEREGIERLIRHPASASTCWARYRCGSGRWNTMAVVSCSVEAAEPARARMALMTSQLLLAIPAHETRLAGRPSGVAQRWVTDNVTATSTTPGSSLSARSRKPASWASSVTTTSIRATPRWPADRSRRATNRGDPLADPPPQSRRG